jgi:hypothetical protein
MSADDFERPMNSVETALFLLPWIPAIWLGAILVKLVLKIWRAW